MRPGIAQWAHRAVWTACMLATLLENKVREGKWNTLSPVLANAYLNPVDHHMAEQGFQMKRYTDDFVILCRTPEEAEAALAVVQTWVENAGLTLHKDKTHVVDRLRDLTSRKSGESLDVIIQRLNRTTRGWFNYFRHCHWSIFRDYDGLIRRRLRRLLLKRHRRNRQHLTRTQRWPNAYFTKHGLISLNEAHVRFVQSVTGTY